MKHARMTVLAVMAALMMTTGISQAQDTPSDGQLVNIADTEIFIPNGFDDNDEVMVMIDGFLPSSCYRLSRPEVAFQPVTNTIIVNAVARYFDAPCMDVLVPFSQEVPVGVLPMGDFTVTSDASEDIKTLTIAESNNSGPDDFLYAPVDSVAVDVGPEGDLEATVSGRFTNSCMAIDSLRLQYQRSEKTILILPIMDMAEGDCQVEERHFKEVIPLPADLDLQRYLLHVRSLNGKAVNLLFSPPAR